MQLNRLRVIQALRLTLLSGSILVVAALAGMSTGIATLVPGIMFVLFLKDETFQATFALLAGVFFGGAVVLLTTYFWAQDPPIYLIVSMAFVFAMAYWAAQGIRGRWGNIGFPIGTELCLLSAVFAEMTGAQGAIESTQVWMVETPVGTVLFWILLIGLWPSPSARNLDRLVDAVRGECALLLRKSSAPVAEGKPATFVPSLLSLQVFGDLTRLLNQNVGRLRSAAHDRDFLMAKLEVLSQTYSNIRYIGRAFEDLPDPGLSTEARNAATQIMSALADGLSGKQVSDTTASFAVIRREEQDYVARGPDELTARRLAARLSGFTVAAEALMRDIAILDDPDGLQAAVILPQQPVVPSAFLMMDSLQAATKIVIGVLAGLLVFMATDLPANSYLVIIVLIVLVQPNLGRAYLRLRLWFPGVLAGSLWAVAGLTVLSALPYFGVYLVWLLPGLFVAGYIGTGPDRISYVGIQLAAGMATILGMAVFPVNNVVSADARILGAAVGFLIALTVYHLIWPVHPATLLRQNLSRNLRDMMEVLSRICAVEAAERDAPRETELTRQISAQKLQIQADFGLLYDMSYMFSRRVRPPYDYAAIMHNLGLIYQQIWCLHQALSADDSVDGRRRILAPVMAARKELSIVFEELAGRLDRGDGATARDMAQPIQAIRTQLLGFLGEIAADTNLRGRHDTEYGVNVVSMIVFHLDSFADAMHTANESQVFRTAEPAQLYEGANR